MSIWDISRHLVVASLQMPFLPGFGVCISGAVLRAYAAKPNLPYLGAATFVFS